MEITMDAITHLVQLSIYNMNRFPKDKVQIIERKIEELEPADSRFIDKLLEYSASIVQERKLLNEEGWVVAIDKAKDQESKDLIISAAACSLLVAMQKTGINKSYAWWKEQTMLGNDLTLPASRELQ
jgi:mRNA degradation ribonuclease J1/J2